MALKQLSRQAKETNPSLHTMSASRAIADRRELHRLSPRLLLEMRDHPERLAALPDETVDVVILPESLRFIGTMNRPR